MLLGSPPSLRSLFVPLSGRAQPQRACAQRRVEENGLDAEVTRGDFRLGPTRRTIPHLHDVNISALGISLLGGDCTHLDFLLPLYAPFNCFFNILNYNYK